LVTLSKKKTAIVCAPNPKEMQEAYEIRAGLEEISGRIAATAIKGNTGRLRYELAAMRAALEEHDLDACAEHDVRFHRAILRASQNDVLLRVWDALAVDLRMRATIGKVTQNLPAVVDSHQPIVEALDRGQGREAGLLLRNHVETVMQFLKKADFDSGVQRAVAKDLETAKDIQNALFPSQSFSIPCLSCEVFYQPARGIGGDYYDFLSLSAGRWGIAIGDVSGKGIGAALLMASLQASLRAQALHPHLELSAIIGGVNHLVHESSPTGVFASLFYAEYEPSSRRLQYVNAGHNPPIIVRPQHSAANCFTCVHKLCPSACTQRFNSRQHSSNWRKTIFWWHTQTESRRRPTLLANSGEWKGSRACCGLAAEWRQGKSLNASWPKYPTLQMTSHSVTM